MAGPDDPVPAPPGDAQIDPDFWQTLQALDTAWELIKPHVVSAETYAEELFGAAAGAVAAAVAAATDPRTPIQKLLESWILEEEKQNADDIAHWNDSEARQDVNAAAQDASAAVAAARANENPANQQTTGDAVAGAAAAAFDPMLAAAEAIANVVASASAPKPLPAPDADIHVSDTAPIFKSWHLGADKLAEDFVQPLVVPSTDADTLAAIDKNRKSLPDVQGSGKGQLKSVKYGTRGTSGYMLVEDETSEYGQWLAADLLKDYKNGQPVIDSSAPPADGQATAKAFGPARLAAAVIAIRGQEGSPSTINTYDGLVLTWGTGIAAPGKLPELFASVIQSPRVKKAFYLCGFLYQGIIMSNGHHGAYQIVDLPNKSVVFRDNFYHDTSGTHHKGDYQGQAFTVLKVFTSQVELINMLVQVARDPMTRDVVQATNKALIKRMAVISTPEQINSEALYVFAAQLRHNWALGPDIVQWAVNHFTSAEAATDQPSEERDVAIAKGLVRRIASKLQAERWVNAKIQLKKSGGPVSLVAMDTQTEWGLDRLFDKYWTPLQTGAKTQDGSMVTVPNFFLKNPPSRDPKRYTSVDRTLGNIYDLGEPGQFDLLFDQDDVKLLRFDKDNIVIQEGWSGTTRTVKPDGSPA